ncbi:hypothetical protein BU15DRAFT_82847 [Melanogaster broomeanus]|nr:hypothetical protein BU15DRAFT_82847 [Melanogaster broomeanus]
MASDLQSILASIQMNDYASVVVASAVGYDYILTFPSEIEYIWKRPWSWVSTLFVVLRYVGFFDAILGTFYGSSFVRGPIMTYVVSTRSPTLFNYVNRQGTVLYLAGSWTFFIFIVIADFLMILRVYAMYNRSRMILSILLVTYIPTVVLLVVSVVLEGNPKTDLLVTNPEVLDVSFCVVDHISRSRIVAYIFIPRLIFGGFLYILALTQFVRQSLEMHRAIQRWRSNRYMELLVRQSIIYFIANFMYTIATLLSAFNLPRGAIGKTILLVSTSIFPFILAPRFVFAVRELHSRVVGGHVDTGFGVVSRGISTSHSIAFARAGEVLADTTDTVGDGSRAEGPHEWSDDRGAGARGEAVDGIRA